MSVPRYRATRFEGMLTEGRTHPIVLGCRSENSADAARSMVVKAIGCPEVNREWQLVAEVVGNAIARRCGIVTPEPAIIQISPAVATAINSSDDARQIGFAIHPGFASGCSLIKMQPYTSGQSLSAAAQVQAVKIFLFDLLAQNSDRRPEKVNCGVTAEGLVAFDFELCFAHKFLPIIGGSANPWEPSNVHGLASNHLFRHVVRKQPLGSEIVYEMLDKLSAPWWQSLFDSLPVEWQGDAARIGEDLRAVADHAEDFYKDVSIRCLM